MRYLCLFVVLTTQATLIFASPEAETTASEDVATQRDVLQKPDDADALFTEDKLDLMHLFLSPHAPFPPQATLLMSKITSAERSPEEQCEAIKNMATQISSMMNSELLEVMNMFIENCEKQDAEKPEESHKSKRSVESPLDSSQRLMRLLRHIKTNNEHQNIAIEQLMTAQEIADKFGIDFTPESEILSQLETSTIEHAIELNDLMGNHSENKNVTHEQVTFVPLEADQHQTVEANPAENNTYYVYAVPEAEILTQLNAFAPHEYRPDVIHMPSNEHHSHHDHHLNHNHHHHNHQQNQQFHPIETQMMPPPVQQQFYAPPVTPKPTYYDMFAPAPEFFSPIMFEPITTTTTIALPFEETVEPEPVLVEEEFEETVSSKVTVDHEQNGESTVNHVMTYTVAEKAHYKKPEFENLPQQMQYSFFLM